jgi:hypothetical protein
LLFAALVTAGTARAARDGRAWIVYAAIIPAMLDRLVIPPGHDRGTGG